MDFVERQKLVIKAKIILNTESVNKLNVRPWNPNKIKRASNWFGNDERVQSIIADHFRIKK